MVDLGGLGSYSVEQIGVAVTFRVHPGNAIQASVRYQPPRRKFLRANGA